MTLLNGIMRRRHDNLRALLLLFVAFAAPSTLRMSRASWSADLDVSDSDRVEKVADHREDENSLSVKATNELVKQNSLSCRKSTSCGRRCDHTTFWKRFEEFRGRKRHEAALLLGNGPSANLIGPEESAAMSSIADIWVTNQFFVHKHVTPDFHHIEIKGFTERFWIDNFDLATKQRYSERETMVWSLIRDMKNDAPMQCRDEHGGGGLSQCHHDCGLCTKRVLDLTGRPYNIYTLESMLPDDLLAARAAGNQLNYKKVLMKTRSCNGTKAKVHECAIGKSCFSSMTTLLDMIVRMGYKRLYVLGIDLNSNRHFYNAGTVSAGTLNPAYAHLKLPGAMNETDGRSGVHKTASLGVQQFIPEFLYKYRIRTINLSPTSLLSETLQTFSVKQVTSFEKKLKLTSKSKSRRKKRLFWG